MYVEILYIITFLATVHALSDETICVFIEHAEKYCVLTSDKNRRAGQVCEFLYLFVRFARCFAHAMRDAPETKGSPRNKATWVSRAQLDVSIIFTRIYDLITRLLAAQYTPDTANRH